MWLILSCSAATLYIIYKCYIYPLFLSPLRHLPGPPLPWIPIFGNLLDVFRADIGVTHARWIQQYGPVIRVYGVFNTPNLFIADPALVQHVIGKYPYLYVKPDMTRKSLEGVTGRGLVVADGVDHKRQRKYLQEAFQYRNVKEMAPTMHNVARQLVTKWKGMLDTEDVIIVDEGIGKATLEIIGRVGFGHDFHALGEQSDADPLYKACTTILGSANSPLGILGFFFPRIRAIIPLYRKMNMATEVRDTVILNIIRKRQQDTHDSKTLGTDLLSVMLRHFDEEGDVLAEEEEIKAQVMTFAVAGYETTANALAWTIYALSLDEEIQNRLHQEILDYFPHGLRVAPSADELNKLPYLEKVIKEVLRLHSPTTITLRTNLEDDTLPNGLFLPKGTNVTMIKTVMHTLPSIWGEDAHGFRPERWSELDTANIPHFNYIYIPFLAGARSCIGSRLALLELKMLICCLVSEFAFSPVSGHVVRPKFGLMNKPLPHVKVHVHARLS